MSRLKDKLKELDYEVINLQNEEFICIKRYKDIETVITLNNGIIIEDLCEVRIQGNYGFNNYEALNGFCKSLTRAYYRLLRDLEVLKEYE